MSDPTADGFHGPAPTGEPTLVETNARVHAALEDLHWDLVEAVTALDFPAAQLAFSSLRMRLHAHVATEETQVLPMLRRLTPDLAAQEPPVDVEQRIKLIDGDHTILSRCETAIEATLATFGESTTRRDMVKTLDTLLRFGRVLEHHTSREEKSLYPLLDPAASTFGEIDPGARDALRAELLKVLSL